jgi:AcrR family transcriptional regulator
MAAKKKRNAPATNDDAEPASNVDLVFPEWKSANTKGRETRELILRSALAILINEGYKSMSMRRVAAKAGMKFGNLTYHYPSRKALVDELLDSVFRAYDVQTDAIQHHLTPHPEDRLIEICVFALRENRTKKTARLFPELWALANHDRYVSERVHALYRRSSAPVVEVVRDMRPDLSPDICMALTMYITAATEGMMVHAGYKKPFEPWVPAFERIVAKSLVDLVKSVTAAEVGKLAALPPASAKG